LFAKDVYERWLVDGASESHLLRVSRLTTIGLAALALALALTSPRVVDAVVISVVASHAATFFPILAGLYWKRVAPAAGFWAVLCAAAGGLGSHFVLYRRVAFVGALHPLFFGPLVSVIVLVVVTILAPPRVPGGDAQNAGR